MDPRATYLLVALQKGHAQFLSRFANGFLIRRGNDAPPLKPVPHDDDEDASLSAYHTALFDTARVRAGPSGRSVASSGWIAVAVERQPDSPYEDRISVGRTRNCDIALRFATVSKRHAHFWCEAGRVTHLADNQSANGTAVNGQRITPRTRVPVAFGDRVSFGDIELEYVSASAFYALIAPGGTVPP